MGRPFRSPAPTARDAVQASEVAAVDPAFEPAPGQGAEPAAEPGAEPGAQEATEHAPSADARTTPWEPVPSVEEPLAMPESSSDWLVTEGEAVGGGTEESRTVESADASAEPHPAATTGWDAWSGGSIAADTAADTALEQTSELAEEPVAEPGQQTAEPATELGGQLAEPPASWASDAMADLPGRGDEAWEIGAVPTSWTTPSAPDDAAVPEAEELAADTAGAAALVDDAPPVGGEELASDAFAFPELPEGHDPFGPEADVFVHEPLAVGEVATEGHGLIGTDWSWSQPQAALDAPVAETVEQEAGEPDDAAVETPAEPMLEQVTTDVIGGPADDPADGDAHPADSSPVAALVEAAAESRWPVAVVDELVPQGDPLLPEVVPDTAPAFDGGADGEDTGGAALRQTDEQGAALPIVAPAQENLAVALATLAERVRAGELEVPGYRAEQGEAAALAATLAALLNTGR